MSHCGNEENTTPTDPRIDFIAEYTLKSLRLKSDKWSRLIAPDEIKKFFNRFLEQDKPQVHKYIVIFYTEILTGKVVLWCFFSSETSEKIHNSTFQVKISV